MAMSADQGLLANAVNAFDRAVRRSGSSASVAGGIGGGPSGLPLTTAFRPMSVLGAAGATGLLFAVSMAPPTIHWRIKSAFSLGSGGDFGGMNGIDLCDIDR